MYDIQCYEGEKVVLEVVAADYKGIFSKNDSLIIYTSEGKKITITSAHCIIKDQY